MTWAAVGVGAATMATSMYTQNEQQKAQAKAQQANMEANAAQIENSPWTGMKADMMKAEANPDNTLGAGVQGGLQGYMFGKQFAGKTPPPKAPANSAGLDNRYLPGSGSGPLGGPGYGFDDPNYRPKV